MAEYGERRRRCGLPLARQIALSALPLVLGCGSNDSLVEDGDSANQPEDVSDAGTDLSVTDSVDAPTDSGSACELPDGAASRVADWVLDGEGCYVSLNGSSFELDGLYRFANESEVETFSHSLASCLREETELDWTAVEAAGAAVAVHIWHHPMSCGIQVHRALIHESADEYVVDVVAQSGRPDCEAACGQMLTSLVVAVVPASIDGRLCFEALPGCEG